MKINRRKFIVLSTAAAAIPSLLMHGSGVPTSLTDAGNPSGNDTPWHQRVRRLGQVNFNERDPVELDVERWADTWAELKVDAVFVSVTGIIAFYPTEVPYFRRSRYLGDRDLFGECCTAAKKRGIRVIGRYSPDLQWGDALKAHPEWFRRNFAGEPVGSSVPNLYHTCSFTDYYTEQMPAIMREINEHYDVDAIYTNGWPQWGDPPKCYCKACRTAPEPGTPEYSERYLKRTLKLWHLFNSIAREKKPDGIFFGNLGGGIGFEINGPALATECHWFNCDNQGRHGATPAWKCAQQGRVAYAMMKGRTTTNVIGSWATGTVQWRNTAKGHDEAMLWMAQTAASGMRVWYHWLGAQGGLGLDHRWPDAGREFFTWQAKHDEHFTYRKPIADLGIVWSQRSDKRKGGTEFMEGLYAALVQGRFAFDLVHEDDLGAERLRKYRALILPNVTVLTDAQCAQLRAYADAGGSLLATFETGLYSDTTGTARSDFGLADIFGISRDGEVIGPVSNFGSYARIRQPENELLRGIGNTELLPAGEYVVPVSAKGIKPILTIVPAYSGYPPEMCYAQPGSDTQRPLFVPREKGDSRRLYVASDLERCAWRSSDADLAQLLQNAISWVMRDHSLLRVKGEGVVEIFGWETDPGFAVHLLNYNNPNLYRAGIRRFFPVGSQTVTLEVPGGRKIARVQLLRAEKAVPFEQHNGRLEFTVPSVNDYEVAAITLDQGLH